ncbi:hypothetical protein [Streptomyces sp. NRRL S-337]|uniref:hypothetical protein n=1 Tax=Streptomyces sp. NRRL S-337 TaxID=1463900 RepID=UPI0004C6C790|nr:hypothetical protein [Streptomyces sp. NRRL S-337]
MALSLFTRRMDVQDPATWTPPGTIVVQRYRNVVGPAEGAVVLVYTADSDCRSAYFATACLGCTYRMSGSDRRSPLTQAKAADLANAHAATCHAMNCGVPAAPNDTEATRMVRSRLWGLRPHGTSPHYVHLTDFHVDRVDLQRDAAFIKKTMVQLTHTEPHFLTSRTIHDGKGTQFLVQPHPPRG